MKKLMTALLAVSAIAAAAPAVAQDYGRGDDRRTEDRGYDRGDDRRGGYDRGYGRYGDDLRRQYERLADRIQRSQRSRAISYREADRLNQQLRVLRTLDRSYRHSGGRLTRWEQRDLEQRVERLQRQIRSERRDGDSRRY